MPPIQATPQAWAQQPQAPPTGKELLQLLKQGKGIEQDSFDKGVTDPLEMDFSAVVRPVMESCKKDSIAVSHPRMTLCNSLTVGDS